MSTLTYKGRIKPLDLYLDPVEDLGVFLSIFWWNTLSGGFCIFCHPRFLEQIVQEFSYSPISVGKRTGAKQLPEVIPDELKFLVRVLGDLML